MDNQQKVDSAHYDPATMAASSLISAKVVWYKRPWFMITAAVVLVVAVSVITDLPHHVSPAEDAAAQNASLKQINADIAPCSFAVQEVFSFYQKQVAGQLTASNLKQVPRLLNGDQTACSFASPAIYDLTSNYTPFLTKAGKQIDQLRGVVVTWISADALGAIEDIQYLFDHPGDPTKLAKLAKRERYLTSERALALADLQSANQILGTQLSPLKLPILPTLPGT